MKKNPLGQLSSFEFWQLEDFPDYNIVNFPQLQYLLLFLRLFSRTAPQEFMMRYWPRGKQQLE
jgi:hypothetical protein